MTKLKASQKKEWAQTLFVTEGLTQKEIAEKTGVSAVTINKWANENGGKWKTLRQNMLITRQEQLKLIYMQISELNTHIMNRPEGERFANSKEADALSKLTTAAKTLENETSIADVIEVAREVLNYVRASAPTKAETLARLFDDFIKEKLKA